MLQLVEFDFHMQLQFHRVQKAFYDENFFFSAFACMPLNETLARLRFIFSCFVKQT